MTVLRSADYGVWWQFKPNLADDPGRAAKNLPDMAGLAVDDEQSLVVFMETEDGRIHSAPTIPQALPALHGRLATGTGVGVVVLEDF